MEGDGRPTNEVAVACGRGCGGRGVHLTPAPRDQDHQQEIRRQGPGGSGEGDHAARPCVCVVTSRYSSEGRASRLGAGDLTTTRTCLSVYVLWRETLLISESTSQRPAGLPVLTSQSAFRLSITTSR